MFALRFLLSAVVAATHIHSALAFQPGSDYNAHPVSNLHNCTEQTFASDLTVRNTVDSYPQIDPSSERGWEQWTLLAHGTYQFVFRWSKGNPSSNQPLTQSSRFDILAIINGTTYQSTVAGDLSFSNTEHVKQITIGNNSLAWDPVALWFNASVNVDGYQIQLDSFSSTQNAFHPNVASYNGMLDQSGAWFGSVPVIRGHVSGGFVTPTKQNVTLAALSVIQHTFSDTPLSSYITKYSAGAIWGYSTQFYDSHVFFQTQTTSGAAHQAAFHGRGIPSPKLQGDFVSSWATYAMTDDNLYYLDIDSTTNQVNVSFSGCTTTNNYSYLFNTTIVTPLGEFFDIGGGKTAYFRINNGTTNAPFNGAPVSGVIEGLFGVYVVPSTNSSGSNGNNNGGNNNGGNNNNNSNNNN